MQNFQKTKKDFLSKIDKSFIGSIDIRIQDLCNIINSRKDMFTLSSCSGRICLLAKFETFQKQENIWLYMSHDYANETEIIKIVNKYNEDKIIEFRQESSIIHICTESIELARKLMHIGKESGFNQVGIIAIKSKIVVEIICDVRIIVPIYDEKLLICENHLKYLISKSSIYQEKSWNSIKKLQKSIKSI